MILNRKQKEALVIKLAHEGKTTRDIAREVHISPKDICEIIRKITGDINPSRERKEEVEKQNQADRLKRSSSYAQAFQMFREKKELSEVVVELDLSAEKVLNYYTDYLRLTDMKKLVPIIIEVKNDMSSFIYFYRKVRKEGLDRSNISNLLRKIKQLSDMDKIFQSANGRLRELEFQKASLEEEIDRLSMMKRNSYEQEF